MLKAFQDLGFQPQFVSDDELAGGAVKKRGIRVLGLPQSILGQVAAERMEKDQRDNDQPDAPHFLFVSAGPWSLFDEHGRLPASSVWLGLDSKDTATPLMNQSMVIVMNDGDKPHGDDLKQSFSSYLVQRLSPAGNSSFLEELAGYLKPHRLMPPIRIPPSARVMTHRFKLGTSRLLAFERNIEWRMSEDLKQAGGNAELEKPVAFTAEWDEAAEVVDLRTGERLGRTNKIEVHLDPWQPSLYALLPAPVQGDVVTELLKNAPP